MIIEIEVENIKCSGCTNTITKSLYKTSGVNVVSVDIANELVSIDTVLDRSTMVEKLASLGYPEKGNNNILYKGKSVVSCIVGRM